ncbi:MAG TPA: MM0924 family protein [Pyrinomonadaceae bacterium]|nr:MM0924 family protein [Pyrinomonadaceae bacterium]
MRTLIGRKIDARCGATSNLHGEIMNVENGVLHLKDEDGEVCYVAVDKIIAVWEKRDKDKERQPGFVFKS